MCEKWQVIMAISQMCYHIFISYTEMKYLNKWKSDTES